MQPSPRPSTPSPVIVSQDQFQIMDEEGEVTCPFCLEEQTRIHEPPDKCPTLRLRSPQKQTSQRTHPHLVWALSVKG